MQPQQREGMRHAAFAPCRTGRLSITNSRGFGQQQHGSGVAVISAFHQSGSWTCRSALSTLSDASEAAPVFEPVVNIPALGSFIVIVVVFSLLQLRIRSVEDAVERRKKALVNLRDVKSKELSSSGTLGEEPPPDPASAVEDALREYENALQNEEDMRTILPGVRIVAPNGPASDRSPDDVIAAKQFLGIDLEQQLGQQQQKSGNNNKEDKNGLSAGAVAVLAVVALSQLALLYMLSFDPMGSSSSIAPSF